MNRSNSALFFLHIPKAAGMTLHRILERNYPPEATYTMDPSQPQASVAECRSRLLKDDVRLVKGHMGFGLHRFAQREFTYITLLRHPVNRIASIYNYIRCWPDHVLHRDVTSMDLRSFAASRMVAQLDNGQTRLLAGVNLANQAGLIEHREYIPCTAEHLQQAKENLHEHFAVVGLSERFDETLLLMRQSFKWAIPLYMRQNVTPIRPTTEALTTDVAAEIEQANALDMELYDFANTMFCHAAERAGPELARMVRVFRKWNRLYAIIPAPLQNTLVFCLKFCHSKN